ncbi:MAG: M48 family metalloprotease [Acidimicrobiales bacterium]
MEVAAVLYAAPTLARSSRIPVLDALCQRMLGPLASGGPVTGWIAAAVALMLPALGGLGWARARHIARSARIERGLGRHRRCGEHQLVVLPTPHLVAVSVPALPGVGYGQIVVSEGLVDTLAPGELDAVLRHEAAHLDHRHHRYLAAAAVIDHAFAWFPPARRSTATLRVALERWGRRRRRGRKRRPWGGARRPVGSPASLVADPSIAAFSAAETIGERLDALETDAPQPRLGAHVLLYCPGAMLGATVLVAMSSWASGASSVLAMAGQCVS